MDQQEVIREMKAICILVAANFEVPPALVEIILMKRLSESQKTRPMIAGYLKEGHLSRLLINRKGKFLVELDDDQVRIQFSDGTMVSSKNQRKYNGLLGWNDLTGLLLLASTPALYFQIKVSLNDSIKSLS